MDRYSARKGVAHLHHSSRAPPASTSANVHKRHVVAVVDVSHALGGESFQGWDLQVGSWINVVGYLSWEQDGRSRKHRRQDSSTIQKADQRRESRKYVLVNVQAIMIWSAGSLRLDAYEHAVRMRMQSEGEAI